MILRTNAPIVPTIVLRGTAEDLAMAETYFLALHVLVYGSVKGALAAQRVAPLHKFLLYRDACARAISC